MDSRDVVVFNRGEGGAGAYQGRRRVGLFGVLWRRARSGNLRSLYTFFLFFFFLSFPFLSLWFPEISKRQGEGKSRYYHPEGAGSFPGPTLRGLQENKIKL